MDFSLTDEQELLIESAKEYADRYFDEESCKAAYENHHISIEQAMAYREAGFMHLGLPEEVGGVPVSKLTEILLVEKLHEYTGVILPFVTDFNTITDVIDFGNEEQQERIMDVINNVESTCVACSAISEPAAGSDNNAMTCVTKKQPDGTYLLNGQKTWVTLGGLSVYTMVVAKDEDPSYENKNYSLWLVKNDTPGFTVGQLEKVGQQSIPFVDCFFDNVKLTEADRIGNPGEGWLDLMKKLEFERMLVVASSLGLAQAAMNDAAAYASERICFGKPIAHLTAIQDHLCEMENILDNVRSRLYRVVDMIDRGESTRLESALLKGYACRELTKVGDLAMSIYAAIGYTKEIRVGRIWADLRGNEMGGGTTEIMEYIAGRQLVKKYKKN
ncbi:MAG: acyl-CoA dehydrogenase family protein [Eggerthellaceae bacterium]|jgi:crotonobetainyl-CoA dehydrogenase